MTDPDPAREFLNAMANIEAALKISLRGRRFTPLKVMAETSRSAGALTEEQHNSLIALADLRNALSHEAYRGGSPIATPHQTTIDEANRLLAYLKSLPLALDLLERYPIKKVSPTDPMTTALTHVQDDFSQFPIYDGDVYIGLLTTNAIGRWLAEQCRSDVDVRTDAIVADLYAFAESSEVAVPLRSEATAAETIRILGDDDKPVRAVIFTESGSINDTPVAVAVREDVHCLYRALH